MKVRTQQNFNRKTYETVFLKWRKATVNELIEHFKEKEEI
jgi:hypothetical protein